MRTTLRAARDLTHDGRSADDDRITWRVTGGRPRLGVDEAPPPGWYLVTTDLVGTTSSDEIESAKDAPVALRFLPASGSVPLARRPVPSVRRRRGRVVHVPEGTERIELDVSPWLDTVSASRIEFRRLAPSVAASMMTADVSASGVAGTTDRRALAVDLRRAARHGGARALLEQVAISYEHLQHRRSGDGVDYPSWRLRNATIFDDDADRLRRRLAGLTDPPLISVVMPVYEPDERWLRAALDSVRAQVYERWEVCVVDDASPGPGTGEVLDEYAAIDDRIRVHRRAENGHIVAATDDELAPFALAVVALAAPDADIVYTDEDKVDGTGHHYDPHCKPPWNPELLLGQNYLSHLTAIRRDLVTRVGGMRTGTEGAQDHDLVLRATAITDASRIVHAPFVAYHWRAIAGSTARATDEKAYTERASMRALRDRLGAGWTVERSAAPSAFRCTPPIAGEPLVSILVPTRDRLELLRQCVDSLARTTWPRVEIVIVDNDSHEPATQRWLRDFDDGAGRRVVPSPGPFNFSRVNNDGARAARGDLLLLLNNDTEVLEPDWLTEMIRWIEQPGVGAVGAKLLYPDDTVQHAGVVLGLGGLAGHGHHRLDRDAHGYFSRLALAHEVGAVTGACLLTHRTTWERLGGLDEDLAVAFNDIDYCLRVRHQAGERIIWTPHALLLHHESVSRGAEDDPAKVARFNAEVDQVLERWGHVLDLDPAYSPNLTLEGDSYTLARRPRVHAPWLEEDPR